MATKFYLCPICGNIVAKIEDGGPVPHCCGQEMKGLNPETNESTAEKHVPVLEKIDACCETDACTEKDACCTVVVKIGSKEHPMTPEHHIDFIWGETIHGGQLRYLTMDGVTAKHAEATFCVCKDPITAVYCYCNIHGLWKLEINADTCNYKAGKCCSSSKH